MSRKELREQLRTLVREYFAQGAAQASEASLPLVQDSLGAAEVSAVLDTLLDGRITMGPRVLEMERRWSEWLGVSESLMVNSGSSANLLGLAALSNVDVDGRLEPGDEVLVPAICWSTSLFPILQARCVPVFVDVDPDTLNLTAEGLHAALSPKTRGVVVVHLLGNPCPMDEIMTLAKEHGLWVLEDCCESHGAQVKGQRVGSFGDLSSFSFYFSHHLTTGEGGMVCLTDTARWSDICRSIRAHGWIRERSDRAELAAAHPGIDDRWLFVTEGYNLRSTDIAAAIGLQQMEKLDGWIEDRVALRGALLEGLRPLEDRLRFQIAREGHIHSGFGFSMILRPEAGINRASFVAKLEAAKIEARPLIGGNMARQPVAAKIEKRIAGELTVADLAHDHGLMIGIHPGVTPGQLAHVIATITKALN